MRRTGSIAVLGLLAAFAFGCSSNSEGERGGQGSAQGSSNGTTQIHARIELAGQAGDVTAILYEVSCDDGTTASEYVPLEDVLSPDFVTGGQYPFADFFQVLPAGATCTITATPMQNPTTPSEDCQPASTTITVEPNVTTEIVLPIQCEGEGASGAIDVVGVLNRPPVITALSLDPSKFLLACVTGTVAVTATDPDGDPLTYAFTVVSTPAGAVYEFEANGNEFTFTGETPGTYIFQVTVTDAQGASTSLQFPIHVQANPDCEHIGEICCQLPDGTVTVASEQACEKAGGIEVADEACKQDVCCKTADGPQIVDAADCPLTAVLPNAMCEQQACCKQGEGDLLSFTFIAATQCKEPAQIVADAMCEEICCVINNVPQTMTAGRCAAFGGAETSPDKCDDKTCCRLEDGTIAYLPTAQCDPATVPGAQPVPMDLCQQMVCCQGAAGTVPIFMPITECEASNGTVVPASQCGPVTVDLNPNFTPDPNEPCEPAPRLVVPSTATHELAVFDTDTMTALAGSPFDTCSSPSRVIFDWNNDIISTCRTGAIQVQKHQIDGTVLWTQSFPNCGGGSRGAVIAPDGRLFASCSQPATVYQLDHATGAVLNTIPIPSSASYQSPHVYGLMADNTGVYAADYFSSHISKIDLATLNVVWQTQVGVYGFSTDGQGSLWAGGATALKKIDAITGLIVNQWNYPAGVSFVHGVMVAPNGFVYGAAGNNLLFKFDMLTESYNASLQTNPGDTYTKGVTAEFDNDVYAINVSSNTITKFPGGNQAGAVSFTTPGINYLYAYSGDMTGLNLCQNGLVAEWFSQPINSGAPTTTWGVLSWSATTPPGTSVTMYYRIDGGPWLLATNGANLGATGQVLELKAVLTAANPALLPTLNSVTVQYTP